MAQELKALETELQDKNPSDFEKTLSDLCANNTMKQREKAKEFTKEAMSSMNNHFERWANNSMTMSPAGEQKMAQVVANKLL